MPEKLTKTDVAEMVDLDGGLVATLTEAGLDLDQVEDRELAAKMEAFREAYLANFPRQLYDELMEELEV